MPEQRAAKVGISPNCNAVPTLTFLISQSALACLQVYIMHAQKFLYVAEIDGSLLMKIGKARYEPDNNKWTLLESGKNWAIWQQA